MTLIHRQIKELLDENLKHEYEGFGPDKVCVRNGFYWRSKAEKSGHRLDSFGKLHLQEQGNLPILEGMTPQQVAQQLSQE